MSVAPRPPPTFSRRLSMLRTIFTDIRRSVDPSPQHPEPRTWSDDRITVAWLGQATVLLNFFGVTILTDPVFFARCGIHIGPFTLGPKRYVACALKPRELPRIDLVLLSHAHFDHLDTKSLRHINRDATVVTARHTADIFRRIRFRKIIELGWGETTEIETPRGSLTLAAFQLRHWGARVQRDEHRTFNAYLIERGGRRLCFMGDTARTDARVLASRGPVDLIVAPIGAYDPWIRAHCTPEEAVAMSDEAGARFILPIHHRTFKLSWEPMDEPIARFKKALAHEPQRIAATEIGGTFVLPT